MSLLDKERAQMLSGERAANATVRKTQTAPSMDAAVLARRERSNNVEVEARQGGAMGLLQTAGAVRDGDKPSLPDTASPPAGEESRDAQQSGDPDGDVHAREGSAPAILETSADDAGEAEARSGETIVEPGVDAAMVNAVAGDTASAGEFGAALERQPVPDGPPRDRIGGIYTEQEGPQLQPAASAAEDSQDETASGSSGADGTDPPDAEGSDTDGQDPAATGQIDPGAIPRPFGLSLPRIPMPRSWRTVAVIAVVPGILLIGFASLDRSARERLVSSVNRPPGLDPTPSGVIQQGSEDYQQSLESANDAGTEEALRTGSTYIPTPEATPDPGEGRPSGTEAGEVTSAEPGSGIPEPGNQPETADNSSRPNVTDAGPSQFDPAPPPDSSWSTASSDAIELPGLDIIPNPDPFSGNLTAVDAVVDQINPLTGYLEALIDRPFPRMGGQLLVSPAGTDAPGHPGTASTHLASATPAAPAALTVPGWMPGDMFYAEMLNTLNSDLPGPALASLVEGRWRGARLKGSFQPLPDAGGLALRFSELILPGGDSFAIEAFGLSPWTGQQLTRSRLERRLMQRVGTPALIALLSGAASRIGEPRRSISVEGDSIVVERSGPSDREIIASGVAAAAGAIGSAVVSAVPSGPRILLEAGSPVVILYAGPGASGSSQPVPPAPQNPQFDGTLQPPLAGAVINGPGPAGAVGAALPGIISFVSQQQE